MKIIIAFTFFFGVCMSLVGQNGPDLEEMHLHGKIKSIEQNISSLSLEDNGEFEKGDLLGSRFYSFNINGFLTLEKYASLKDSSVSVKSYTYDNNGKLESHYSSDEYGAGYYEYVYKKDGFRYEYCIENSIDTVSMKKERFNKKRQLISLKNYSKLSSGWELWEHLTFQYDSEGYLVVLEERNEADSIVNYEESKYSNQHLFVIESYTYVLGKVKNSEKTFNENGDILSHKNFYKDGKVSDVMEYEYEIDENGNWSTCKVILNGTLGAIWERRFIYFR